MSPLHHALKASRLFAHLEPHEIDSLLERSHTIELRAGEVLYHEGDSSSGMYVVQSGAVQLHTRAFDGSELVLERVGAGGSVGAESLLGAAGGRRPSSARAQQATTLLVLTRSQVRAVVARDAVLREALKDAGEARHRTQIAQLRDALFEALGVTEASPSHSLEVFPAGTLIFRRGDPCDKVYLILKGRCQTTRYLDERPAHAELLPGQFFGVLAMMPEAIRSMDALALDDLEVASLEGARFRELCESHSTLRTLLQSVSSIYLSPQRGVLSLQITRFEGELCQTAVYHQSARRRVVTHRRLERSRFTATLQGAAAADTFLSHTSDDGADERELQLCQGRLVHIDVHGHWDSLGHVLEALLDGLVVEAWQQDLFRSQGELHSEPPHSSYESREVVCTCAQVTCARIQQALAEGCRTVHDIAAETGATAVCGGCVRQVRDLIGRDDWSLARLTLTRQLNPSTRELLIRPLDAPPRPYQAGQHLIVQARIDNHQVQRPYTIAAPYDPQAEGYTIIVKREPRGVFSRWLFDRLPAEALVRVSEPTGSFVVEPDQTGPAVFVVGGIGVTPALAALRQAVARGDRRQLHLDYSASQPGEHLLVDELTAAAALPGISVNLRTTRTQGRIDRAAIAALDARFPQATWFLCGSSAFLQGIGSLLQACAIPDERIRREAFHLAYEPPPTEPAPILATCPVQHSTPPATALEQSRSILHQYYHEVGAAAALGARWEQVEAEIGAIGTYRQTYEELSYTGKLAWRNSTRCIGRLYWEGLAVRDYRHVTQGEDMLDALFEHIALATNGGNLRPMMTVFAPKAADGDGPRIYNAQLIRYAGYRQPDGSVLGDPANLELTEIALALGWQPPAQRGPFDLLPLIVSTGRAAHPVWRAYPEGLVHEVAIEHPTDPRLTSLGLRWYALPAVSSFAFDPGGVVYPAAPFNGWYMGTEIGARNFTDTARYNLLPALGAALDLDTSSERSLWRDRALLELNVAVLHSFEKAGVTLMDHHSASQSFDRFEALEKEAGREVCATWSWIVPPMSGGITSVFHRTWRDVERKPYYQAQPDPWKDGYIDPRA